MNLILQWKSYSEIEEETDLKKKKLKTLGLDTYYLRKIKEKYVNNMSTSEKQSILILFPLTKENYFGFPSINY
ncbi:hypothetical protein J6TS2_44490 [Heyndrickxia sporothermodurans]|nr:hypothetical protein J6TS2_44490 [Heyndrickxia sporothermodurans]